MKDPIERQDAIDTVFKFLGKREIARTIQTALWILPSAQQDCTECAEYDYKTHSCPRYCDVIRRTAEEAKQERTGRWIPCSERLPEDDVEVLISYRYKEGEGDTSHTDIDITTYGQMYFGGNKVGNYKHWRAPFEYFESNYEVIAWMPLPKPYKEGEG